MLRFIEVSFLNTTDRRSSCFVRPPSDRATGRQEYALCGTGTKLKDTRWFVFRYQILIVQCWYLWMKFVGQQRILVVNSTQLGVCSLFMVVNLAYTRQRHERFISIARVTSSKHAETSLATAS